MTGDYRELNEKIARWALGIKKVHYDEWDETLRRG